MTPERLDQIVLAVLFASEEPLSARKLANIVEEDVSTDDINAAVNRLTALFLESTPSIRLERVAGGFQLVTNPDFSEYVARLYSGRRKQRLSRAALETLAIIAYKQPVTRLDVENIRGVNCGGVVTTLMERSLIRIVGKAKVLGAPFLYGTTQEFLEYLGLNSLKDLPSMEELEELLAREASAEAEDAAPRGEASPPAGPGSARVGSFEAVLGSGGDDDEATENGDEEYERKPETTQETALSDTESSTANFDDES